MTFRVEAAEAALAGAVEALEVIARRRSVTFGSGQMSGVEASDIACAAIRARAQAAGNSGAGDE